MPWSTLIWSQKPYCTTADLKKKYKIRSIGKGTLFIQHNYIEGSGKALLCYSPESVQFQQQVTYLYTCKCSHISGRCSSLALWQRLRSFGYSHHMHWLLLIHTFPISNFGLSATCDQNNPHGRGKDSFAWLCWNSSGLGTQETLLIMPFQCTFHQQWYHSCSDIPSPFSYPMLVQPKAIIWHIVKSKTCSIATKATTNKYKQTKLVHTSHFFIS